ncbi:AMP-dependent synthetase/ligase [Nakamurella leprariae]|uniref:Long-chain fatty acid--CoA ligase n=1 Tax=Nakamurella leprariae TaxID=2803911 RepID=A0A938YIW1_9ACTN|nr:long-chain fatty acid--CoA ligase [Nakamurella leprariae]MBM9468678.1 long-chain fatty acid--CoA ligase [Nakamurella leprariae]
MTSSISPLGPSDRSRSFAHMLRERVAASPDREAFRHRVGDRWESLTWQQTWDRVEQLAAGLVDLGVAAQERVAIASGTRIEWVLADFAVMCAGAATTTVYPSTTPQEVAHILGDSGSVLLFAEDHAQLAKLDRDALPELRHLAVFDDGPGAGSVTGDVLSLDALAERGRALLTREPETVKRRIDELEPERLATLIYTSGTTGTPKGVRLVHDNWTYEAAAIEPLDLIRPDDLHYLWLPLSHVFGKMLLAIQLQIGFATAVDGDLDRIVANLAAVQPTFMCGAPRIFEKVRARATMTAHGAGGAKARIFDWGFGVGVKVSQARQSGTRVAPWLAAQHAIADRLVFTKIRHVLGGRIRRLVSGSAKLSRDVAEWFDAAGLPILEGYGLTETSAATFVNLPGDNRIGTVGPPVPGTEVIIASDGEILVRGPGVMRGYHNRPDATDDVLTADGWFHTGDIGELRDGNLVVTDRKKDLIKTSGGKYVAPQKIETLFKAHSPYVSQVVVHGDGRNFVSALITLEADAVGAWATGQGLQLRTPAELAAAPEVRELLDHDVQAVNSKLERWETIKRYTILPHDLTVEDGELTPSLKVRRKAVENRYADQLDALYADVD